MHGLLDKLRKANAPQAKPMDVLNGEENSHRLHTQHPSLACQAVFIVWDGPACLGSWGCSMLALASFTPQSRQFLGNSCPVLMLFCLAINFYEEWKVALLIASLMTSIFALSAEV